MVASESSLRVRSSFARRRRWRRQATHLLGRLLIHAVLILIGITFALPFLWMLSTSLKPSEDLFTIPPIWIPNPPLWGRYIEAWNFVPFGRWLLNTVYISLYAIVAGEISCCLTAYGFSKLRWKGRDVLFIIMMATTMLPYMVILIPQYIMFARLQWLDTFKPLTIPWWFGWPVMIFLFRQFFMTIPDELVDSAKIDGANEIMILTRIILPLSRPVVASVAVFTYQTTWNEFLLPLLYLNHEEKLTLTLGLYRFRGGIANWNWGMMMAGATMITIPSVVVFFFAQKTFIQGITVTGLRG